MGYQRIKIAIMSGIMLVTSALSLADDGSLEQMTNRDELALQVNDSAIKSGEKLSEILASKLKAEGSRVVFINIASCSPPRVLNGANWCKSFEASLNSNLIKSSIKFLPELQKDDVREKIASEQVYQHDSMQVDSTRAVELGKQKAFQAFVSVNVETDRNVTQIRASSVNIKESVVTISETMQVNYTNETYTPWSSRAKKWSIFALGIGVGTGCFIASNREKEKSDQAYADYKNAKSTDDATKYRGETERHGRIKGYYDIGIWTGAAIFVWGFFVGNNNASSLDYEIKVAGDTSAQSFSIAPLASDFGLTSAISWHVSL